jgi:Arm DNA-binding domain
MVARMLTAKALAAIKPATDGTRFLPDIAVGGLGVRFGAKGLPSFTLQYRIGGKQVRVSIGKWWDQPDDPPPGWITLANARLEAVRIKEAAARGIPPRLYVPQRSPLRLLRCKLA